MPGLSLQPQVLIVLIRVLDFLFSVIKPQAIHELPQVEQ